MLACTCFIKLQRGLFTFQWIVFIPFPRSVPPPGAIPYPKHGDIGCDVCAEMNSVWEAARGGSWWWWQGCCTEWREKERDELTGIFALCWTNNYLQTADDARGISGVVVCDGEVIPTQGFHFQLLPISLEDVIDGFSKLVFSLLTLCKIPVRSPCQPFPIFSIIIYDS